MTEFGCLNELYPTVSGFKAQRPFYEARWMFEDDFTDVIAGAFAFEYSTELINADGSYPFKDFSYGNFGIGYFSPENCDEISIPCVYNPKPEFDNLAARYNETLTVGVTMRNNFQPVTSRTVPPACPSGYDNLSAFSWEADAWVGYSCPEPDSVGYQCKASGPVNSGNGTIKLVDLGEQAMPPPASNNTDKADFPDIEATLDAYGDEEDAKASADGAFSMLSALSALAMGCVVALV